MHGTQRRIAVLNRVDDDTHAHQIINVGEIVPAHDHLLVNGEVVLRAACHIGFDVLFVEILIDFGENLLQVHVALTGTAFDERDGPPIPQSRCRSSDTEP